MKEERERERESKKQRENATDCRIVNKTTMNYEL